MVAIVVTYNRKALLDECLQALAAQERQPDKVIVVDNASADGTADFVRAEHPWAELLELPSNQGSAGGFHEGLKAAHIDGADWTWLMDDDTIARPNALAVLLAAPAQLGGGLAPPKLLASKVIWTNGELHPMNHPAFVRDNPERFVLGAEHGLLPLRANTFVSLLVHRSAVDEHGLPHKHFFIWSDDMEYTSRITREGAGYFVPGSVVLHKTNNAHTAVTDTSGRFYFHVRNSLYMLRGHTWAPGEKLSLIWFLLFTTNGYLRNNGFSRESLTIVARGLRDGVKPVKPVIEPDPAVA